MLGFGGLGHGMCRSLQLQLLMSEEDVVICSRKTLARELSVSNWGSPPHHHPMMTEVRSCVIHCLFTRGIII